MWDCEDVGHGVGGEGRSRRGDGQGPSLVLPSRLQRLIQALNGSLKWPR